MKTVLVFLSISLFLLIGIYARSAEKKDYNNGVCKKCGKKLKYFDSCTFGDRGYMCKNGHTVWVSYPGID